MDFSALLNRDLLAHQARHHVHAVAGDPRPPSLRLILTSHYDKGPVIVLRDWTTSVLIWNLNTLVLLMSTASAPQANVQHLEIDAKLQQMVAVHHEGEFFPAIVSTERPQLAMGGVLAVDEANRPSFAPADGSSHDTSSLLPGCQSSDVSWHRAADVLAL